MKEINITKIYNKIKCKIRLHPYKLIVKLKPMARDFTVPFEAWEQCKVCGKKKNYISGSMGSPDIERIKQRWHKKKMSN